MKLILIGESGFSLGTHWLIFGFLFYKKIADFVGERWLTKTEERTLHVNPV